MTSVSAGHIILTPTQWYHRSASVWQHVKLSDVSLGTRPCDSLAADEDVKKPTNQPNKAQCMYLSVTNPSTTVVKSYVCPALEKLSGLHALVAAHEAELVVVGPRTPRPAVPSLAVLLPALDLRQGPHGRRRVLCVT